MQILRLQYFVEGRGVLDLVPTFRMEFLPSSSGSKINIFHQVTSKNTLNICNVGAESFSVNSVIT